MILSYLVYCESRIVVEEGLVNLNWKNKPWIDGSLPNIMTLKITLEI